MIQKKTKSTPEETQEFAIKAENVYKSFKLPHEKITSLKGSLINIGRGNKGYETQQALKDISFEVKKGEFFGIVGKNGSGKSTLLKLLAGIYQQDSGNITTIGSLTPFIELGVGFNPELTGRENVYLNGALLGFSRKEMDLKYKDIVAFAEIERFMDQKLKNYSSGMQVRLAFSIAIQAESDILLFDEVLAVGDASFQQKCFEVFAQIKKKGTTVVLVTHDMSAVQRFCDRGILINNSEIEFEGEPLDIADRYLQENFEVKSDKNTTKEKDNSLTDISISSKGGVDIGAPISLTFTYAGLGTKKFHIGFQIFRNDGVYVYGNNTKELYPEALVGKSKVNIQFDQQLVPGTYYATIAIMNDSATSVVEYKPKTAQFTVKQQTKKQGVVIIEEEWKVQSV